MILLYRSAIPFCSGLCGIVVTWWALHAVSDEEEASVGTGIFTGVVTMEVCLLGALCFLDHCHNVFDVGWELRA